MYIFAQKNILHFCFVLFWSLLLLVACPPLHANSLPGMGSGDTSSSSDKSNVPNEVEQALDMLLRDVSGTGTPDRNALLPLLDYARSGVKPAQVRLKARPQGPGAYMHATLNVPLQRLLRYCYDPAIPGEALYPNVLRCSYWLPESQFITSDVKLWDELEKLADDGQPLVFHGAEFEEITPDVASGCFYSYTLDRLVVLLRYKGMNTLISVTKQRAPSNVGRVGAIVGQDSDWNYVYSNVEGSNISLAKWAKTYMYDSANISIFYETAPGAKTTELAFFKYVRAGWSNMNFVKSTHIAKGAKRYLDGLRQVLESPRLPQAEAIAEQSRKFRGMDENSLRKALEPYSARLAAHANSGPLSASAFKQMVQEQSYASNLNAKEMGSELIKQYVKEQLGKPPLPAAPTR